MSMLGLRRGGSRIGLKRVLASGHVARPIGGSATGLLVHLSSAAGLAISISGSPLERAPTRYFDGSHKDSTAVAAGGRFSARVGAAGARVGGSSEKSKAEDSPPWSGCGGMNSKSSSFANHIAASGPSRSAEYQTRSKSAREMAARRVDETVSFGLSVWAISFVC